MFGFGKKSYSLFTECRATGEQKLNTQLTKEIKAALGPTRKALMEQNELEIRDLEREIAKNEVANDGAPARTARKETEVRVHSGSHCCRRGHNDWSGHKFGVVISLSPLE